jgi:hypothetical protein
MSARAVFVLGMHRSGTSAITRVVNLLGVPLAAEHELRPADDENPVGFWESTALSGANERLLNLFGGAWIAPPSLEPGWHEDARLGGLRREARPLLARVHGTREWAWKDPRNCLTLPFWLAVADVTPAALFVYRHPLEVADSLATRDGLPAAVSFALWERYNRAALASAAGLPTFVVSYDRLVRAPSTVAVKLLGFLRDCAFDVDDASIEEVERFVDPSLRRSGRAEPGDGLDRTQMKLLDVLSGLGGPHASVAPPQLPVESPWVEPLLDARRRVLVLERERRFRVRLEEKIVWRGALGLELGVVRESPSWRLLTPALRLRSRVLAVTNGRR